MELNFPLALSAYFIVVCLHLLYKNNEYEKLSLLASSTYRYFALYLLHTRMQFSFLKNQFSKSFESVNNILRVIHQSGFFTLCRGSLKGSLYCQISFRRIVDDFAAVEGSLED